MGITFAILSFDGKTPVSIDLLIAMLSGDDMAYLIFFNNIVFTLSCPLLFLDFNEFIILIISVSSVHMYLAHTEHSKCGFAMSWCVKMFPFIYSVILQRQAFDLYHKSSYLMLSFSKKKFLGNICMQWWIIGNICYVREWLICQQELDQYISQTTLSPISSKIKRKMWWNQNCQHLGWQTQQNRKTVTHSNNSSFNKPLKTIHVHYIYVVHVQGTWKVPCTSMTIPVW